MPTLARQIDCTGCAACCNACRHTALTMQPTGNFGHLFPAVDQSRCIECKLCEHACPVLHKQELKLPLKTYAAWAKDLDENRKSSSGGIATIAAKYVVSHGGIVYGSASNGFKVYHKRIDSVDGIESLRGSKYVQSSIEDTYRQVKSDLKDGKKVLFIGTPCQVAGLKQYLHKEYDNLIAMDLICHGVPSVKLLQEHLSTKIKDASKISRVSFREGGFILKAFSGKELLYSSNQFEDYYGDTYFASFMKGLTFRDCCYHCQYAGSKRASDITIGDFWGLGRSKPFKAEHPNAGVSVVLPCTDKGQAFFMEISSGLYLEERDLQEAVNGNDQLRSPWKPTFRTKWFRFLIRKGIGLSASMHLTMPDKYLLRSIRKLVSLIKR